MSLPSGKSPAVSFGLVMLAVPVLYLLSVPVFSAIIVKPKWQTGMSAGSVLVPDGWVVRKIPPVWLQTYQKPYRWLTYHTPLRVPLKGYSDWCWRMMERK